jgi:hypothetical protein
MPIRLQYVFILIGVLTLSARAGNPYGGDWALTIPGGAAGWLGIDEQDGKLSGSMLWGWGSVEPVDAVKVDGDTLVITRLHRGEHKNADGKMVKTVATETITANMTAEAGSPVAASHGDYLHLTTVKTGPDGTEVDHATFTGKRQAPVGPAPDLANVKFGDPIKLFNGKNLDGWELTDAHAASGWKAQDGLLINDIAQEPGKSHKNFGNLRTVREFEDFNITLEVNIPKGGNSGVYLRGTDEVQVADTYGNGLNPHNMGALYSRITPTVAAEKPAGQWQTMDITYVDRHVTVILNGTKIIDNQPVRGCTGGALWSDPFRPGPIYLQGDHTGITYRNIVLRPVVKD